MRRATLLFATTAILATSLAPVGSAADLGACGKAARNEYKAKAFHIEYEFDKKLYARGEVVKVNVNVTRPAEDDPLGEGIPLPIPRPFVEPVEGATVGIGFQIGRVYLSGGSVTDAEGNATVVIKIERYAPANSWADASIYAWKSMPPLPCATVVEYGYVFVPRALRTTV